MLLSCERSVPEGPQDNQQYTEGLPFPEDLSHIIYTTSAIKPNFKNQKHPKSAMNTKRHEAVRSARPAAFKEFLILAFGK